MSVRASVVRSRSEGFPTLAINKKVLCVRLWKGDLFLSARSSFLFLSSSSLTQNRAFKLRFEKEKAMFFGRGMGKNEKI